MSVRISQFDERDGERSVLRVEGSLRLEGAELLEQLCRDLREQSGRSLVIDLSGLTFLDGDSAAVLCRLKARPGITLAGLHLFNRQLIEWRQDGQSGGEGG